MRGHVECLHNAQHGGGSERHEDHKQPPTRRGVVDLRREHQQGRNQQGHGDQCNTSLRGGPQSLRARLGQSMHRRMHGGRRRAEIHQAVGQIENARRVVEEVEVGEDVKAIAEEHQGQRGEQKPVGGYPITLAAEGNA